MALGLCSGQRLFSGACAVFFKDSGESSDFWKSKTRSFLLTSPDPTDPQSLPSWQAPLAVAPEILSCFSLRSLIFGGLGHKAILVLFFGELFHFLYSELSYLIECTIFF